MYLRKILPLLFVLVFGTARAAVSPIPALVDAAWLKTALEGNHPGLVILDTQSPEAFKRAHIRGAVNTRYELWRRKNAGGVPAMLPPMDVLGRLIGELGINRNSQVVVVPSFGGASQLAAAARIFWTLKTVGIDSVAVLNGGMNIFRKDRSLPLAAGQQKPGKVKFIAKFRPDWWAGKTEVQTAISNRIPLVDARSTGEYMGIYRGGPDDRPGTIPKALNLPFDWLTKNGSGWLRSREASRALFQQRGVADTGEVVFFCHTGHRAALAWFVDYALLGNHKAKLYDGSMAEWSRPGSTRVERKIQLPD